jgi:predicted nucleic acid-binding Zn ribbon protein
VSSSNESGETRERRHFTMLRDVLANWLERSGVGERLDEAGIVPEWAERVGPAIAAVTIPLRVSHGTLVVTVRSSAWLMELHMMEREIVRRLNDGREKGRIDRIRFLMAGESGSPSRGGPWPTRK